MKNKERSVYVVYIDKRFKEGAKVIDIAKKLA